MKRRAGWVHRDNAKLLDPVRALYAMDADPALSCSELVPLGHLSLPFDFVAKFPNASLIFKAQLLHTINLSVLHF